ncbi:MAG: cache domain-containing protein, partial [Chloroflexota bacterium]
MELEFWGASSAPYLTVPERPLGYLLIAVYIGLLSLAIFQRRRDFSQLSRQQRGFTLLLALVSIIGSQLFLISISTESQLPPLSSAQNPEAYLAPFSFVAFIFAGATLNPLAALIVGFAGGLGRALWQSHQLTELFNYAFMGLIAAYLMQQNYSGRLYSWLRNPIAAGVSSGLILLPLIGLSTLAYADASASNLEALDLALSTTNAYIVPLLAQGLLGGIVVKLLLIGLPQLRPKRREVPSPLSHSLNTRLVATFLLFAVLLSFLLLVIGFNLAIRLSTDLVLDQMARDAQAVSSSIPNFRGQRQNLLVQTTLEDDLMSSNVEESQQVLEQLFKTGPFFRSLILVNASNEIIANYPEDQISESLTNAESIAVEDTLVSGAPFISSAQELEGVEYVLSYVVPVLDDQGVVQAALVGRVPDVSLEELVVALQGTLGQGLGFILDEQNQVIGHPELNNLMNRWEPP